MKKNIFLFLFFVYLTFNLYAQNKDKYGVFFLVNASVAANDVYGEDFLDAIKENWGATGVYLFIRWVDIQPVRSGTYNWKDVDKAFQRILQKGLDIHISLPLGHLTPAWLDFDSNGKKMEDGLIHRGSLSKQDFHIAKDGRHIWRTMPEAAHPSATDSRALNFTSENAKSIRNKYCKDVVNHIAELKKRYSSLLVSRKNIEIRPSVSLYGEMEYEPANFAGYALSDQKAFIEFLKNKYSTIQELKENWGNKNISVSGINNFTDIDITKYNWDDSDLPFHSYDYPGGRMDWLDFREKLLKATFDELASYIKSKGFEAGLQFGSIYDNSLDRRGFLDPTSLAENATALRVADLAGMDYNFSADYCRSICKYWDWKQNYSIMKGFSSETNCHLFGTETDSFHPSPTDAWYKKNVLLLSSEWTKQLTTFKESGGDIHIISGWGNNEDLFHFWASGKEPAGQYKKTDLLVANPVILSWYGTFINKLKTYSKEFRAQRKKYFSAVHLSTKYFVTICDKFRFRSAMPYYLIKVISENESINNSNLCYKGNCDLVTDYMIENEPAYLNGYSNLILNESSEWIVQKAYLNIMSDKIKKDLDIDNGTWYLDGNNGKFLVTPGLYNEYGKKRKPVHLIWRTRRDLMEIFPDANKPVQNNIYWPVSDEYDFVYWLKNNGMGYNNKEMQEYPGLEMYSGNKYIYDENIYDIFKSRVDLQEIFADGHYKSVSGYDEISNILDWIKLYGYKESVLLNSYLNWPYIGNTNINYGSYYIPEEGDKLSALSKDSVLDGVSVRLDKNKEGFILDFSLKQASYVTVRIQDIQGRNMTFFNNKFREKGFHEFKGKCMSKGLCVFSIYIQLPHSSQCIYVNKRLMMY